MSLRILHFAAVLLAALTLGLGLGHLMELPARMAWDQDLWVGATVQGGLFHFFGTLGAAIDVATVILLAVLAYVLRDLRRPAFRLTALAALFYALALIAWWVLVYPANVELAKWVNGPVPADWLSVRARWEWGHATASILQLIGFALLAWSVTPERRSAS